MKLFEDVSAALQVGSRRAPVPRSGHLDEVAEPSQEKLLLIEAGALDLMTRAGAQPLEGIEPFAPAPRETALVATASSGPLSEALQTGQISLVLEWAAEAARLGKVAPHAALPGLLSLSPKHVKDIRPILGERGLWLASTLGIDRSEPSEEGYGDQFREDPAAYREWLRAELPTLDWKERVAALSVLRAGLSPDDEPLLVQGLADRRKEVREEAAMLLALIPSSAFARQVAALLSRAVMVEKKMLGKSLQVQPPEPEGLPKSLPRSAARPQLGPKALALLDLLRFSPPRGLGAGPEDLLPLAQKSEFALALVEGWTIAAQLFEDQEWIDALFRYFVSKEPRPNWTGFPQRVSDQTFEEVLGGQIKKDPVLRGSILERGRPLSLALSKELIEAARGPEFSYGWKEAASLLHPDVLPLLESPWGPDAPNDSLREHWRKSVDLRRRLLRSLQS